MMTQRNTGWTQSMVLLLALGLASLLAGCGSDATASNATLSFSATGTSGALGFSARLVDIGNGVTVDTMRLGVSKIELEEDMNLEVDSNVEFEGSYIVDLLTDTITNTAGGGTVGSLLGTLPPGTYEELEFELTPMANVKAGDATSIALYVTGGYTSTANGNEVRSYTLTATVPMKIEVEGPQGIVVDASANDLIVAFRLDALLTEVNLDDLINNPITSDLGGGAYAIMIDSPADVDFVDPIIHDALEFGEDHNGDHDLDEDEDVDDDNPT